MHSAKVLENIYLIFGDTLVADRWKWLSKRLPKTNDNLRLLDVGCGSGAFTIKSALKGYDCRGLSWDQTDQAKAAKRAALCKTEKTCHFDVFDVRRLDEYPHKNFDVIVNCENIEHIIDDKKLIKDIANLLKPGGYLLMTSPYYFYKAMSDSDNGPFAKIEDGRHVRRGYLISQFNELSRIAGLEVEEISFCSGFLSQKITVLLRKTGLLLGRKLAWILILPLRILPFLFDNIIKSTTEHPSFSICMVAYKPKF